MVYNCWHPHFRASQTNERYMNTDAAPKTPDNPDGIRPGQNIEDAERAPLEHLLFGKSYKKPKWKSAAGSGWNSPDSTPTQPSTDPDYVIDPITNRKVLKERPGNTRSASDGAAEIPTKVFKNYGSHFGQFRPHEFQEGQAPIFYDGPPPESELDSYRRVRIDEPGDPNSQFAEQRGQSGPERSSLRHGTARFSDLVDALSATHKQVDWQRNDGISLTSPEYPDLHKYRPVSIGELPTLDKSTKSPRYKDLNKYTAFRYNEPDGKPSDLEPLQGAEELDKYGAVRSHEPDGKYKVDAEPETDPQELSKYRPVRSHEPDGKYKMQEPIPKHDDFDKYVNPNSPEHLERRLVEAEEAAPDPAELARYREPVLSHEPDGKYAAEYAEPGPDLAELAKYRKPFFSHEPDGKYAASYVEERPGDAELAGYQAFRSHEPDGKYATNYTSPTYDPAELATYGPFRSNEPDGIYAADNAPAEAKPAREAADLGNHEAFGYEDSETIPAYGDAQLHEDASDAPGCETTQMDKSYKPRSTPVEGGYDAEELKKYQAVRWNEPDGKPANERATNQGFFEYDLKRESTSEAKTPYRKVVEELMARSVVADSDTAGAESAARSFEQSAGSQGGVNREDQKAAPLTGNFVRDFPEDFAHDWTSKISEAQASLVATERGASEHHVSETKDTSEPVQPALERLSKFRTVKTASGEGEGNTAQPSQPAHPPEPSLYKILVYDPTMQSIEVAETTSVVPDSAAPLTPAEVLLRISNPARFFPHFAPLQAEGFEIVSGSGDVLIFRKVREANPQAHQTSPAPMEAITSTAAATSHAAVSSSPAVTAHAAVNPIDKTGGLMDYTVAAGRFASPTGFVNYDLPPPNAYHAESAESGSSVRPDESVSRAKKADYEERKHASLPKRVAVGAAWLAGISYSIGVVAEYFKTGGADGKGPKGL
jgi:hypothetical protein